MKDICSGEKCLRELDLNIHLYLTLNYVTASEHFKYWLVHGNVMLFYVFVAFVGLNNNTILAMQNIELVRPIPRSSRKCLYRSDTDPEYQIGAPLIKIQYVAQRDKQINK